MSAASVASEALPRAAALIERRRALREEVEQAEAAAAEAKSHAARLVASGAPYAAAASEARDRETTLAVLREGVTLLDADIKAAEAREIEEACAAADAEARRIADAAAVAARNALDAITTALAALAPTVDAASQALARAVDAEQEADLVNERERPRVANATAVVERAAPGVLWLLGEFQRLVAAGRTPGGFAPTRL